METLMKPFAAPSIDFFPPMREKVKGGFDRSRYGVRELVYGSEEVGLKLGYSKNGNSSKVPRECIARDYRNGWDGISIDFTDLATFTGVCSFYINLSYSHKGKQKVRHFSYPSVARVRNGGTVVWENPMAATQKLAASV